MSGFDFDADIALDPGGDGAWSGAIAPGWDTPRGPLGGYVQALVLEAMRRELGDDERQPRSMTMHFLRAPSAGGVEIEATVERAGRSLSSLSARMHQDGKLIGIALAAFSVAWSSPTFNELPIPELEPVDESLLNAEPPSDRPAFVQRLIMQSRFEVPFSGSEHGRVGGWLGIRGRELIDAAAVCVLADAWFPAPWPRLDELAPAPTIDLTVHFRSPLPRHDGVLLGRFTNRLVRDGFFEEDGELWAPDGTLVAQSRQLGLLLGAKDPS